MRYQPVTVRRVRCVAAPRTPSIAAEFAVWIFCNVSLSVDQPLIGDLATIWFGLGFPFHVEHNNQGVTP